MNRIKKWTKSASPPIGTRAPPGAGMDGLAGRPALYGHPALPPRHRSDPRGRTDCLHGPVSRPVPDSPPPLSRRTAGRGVRRGPLRPPCRRALWPSPSTTATATTSSRPASWRSITCPPPSSCRPASSARTELSLGPQPAGHAEPHLGRRAPNGRPGTRDRLAHRQPPEPRHGLVSRCATRDFRVQGGTGAAAGRHVLWFAYPFGGKNNFRPETAALVEEAGYDGCLSGFGGFVRLGGGWPHPAARFVARYQGLLNLELHLRGCLDWRYALKRGPLQPHSPEQRLGEQTAASAARLNGRSDRLILPSPLPRAVVQTAGRRPPQRTDRLDAALHEKAAGSRSPGRTTRT